MDDWAKLARSGLPPDSSLRIDCFRGSGPGGQKRNKTSSAVRVTHVPTGICAIAGESRSQSENRRRAIQRLCHVMTLQLRLPISAKSESLDLHVSQRNPLYLPVMGLVLDHLVSGAWSVSAAAGSLETSTGKLIDFLQKDDALWGYVNQQRIKAKLRPLI